MLVSERMSHPVITLSPDMPIAEALNLMKQDHIRRAPVVKDGIILGMVSDKDILNASPSPVGSLSVWEMNYLLAKITIKEVMSKKILTVAENTSIEEAASIMADNKIGSLPVMRGELVVGIITETDLFKIFLELMGVREKGVRITALIREERGQLARLTQAIAAHGGNFVAFGQFAGPSTSYRMITFKVADLEEAQILEIIEPLIVKLIDVRTI